MSHVPEAIMYTADVPTIAAGATYATDSRIIDVQRVKHVGLQVYFTGDDAASAGLVTFNVSLSLDGVVFSTAQIPLSELLNGTTKVVGDVWIWDVSALHSIKVDSIENGDPAEAVTLLNVKLWSNG